jgi:protoporphyrinogen oxidase
MNIIVVGTGISGLSISKMLAEGHALETIEKAPKIGGLIKCDRIDGNLFHRVGGHVFNSRNQEVLDWFWKHFDRDNEFLKATRNAKINICDRLVGYPIENYLYQLPDQVLVPILNELLDKVNNTDTSNEETTNFKEFLINNFGQKLYDLYFGPYNTKIWNTNLEDVPLDWLHGKLPMPKLKEVFLSNIVKQEESKMVHSSFYYAKRDGSQFIVNRLAENLNITTSYELKSVQLVENNKLSINNNDKIVDGLVYCGDIRMLHKIISINNTKLNDLLLKAVDLKSNGTSNVLCEVDENDLSWLYLPEDHLKSHRIIFTGNFSDSNNEGTSRKTCVVEFSGLQTEKFMKEELKKLPGTLVPLAFNYEPNSYIIHNKDTKEIVTEIKNELKQYNIYLLGRFAEWEYYNMDAAIEAALKLSKNMVF